MKKCLWLGLIICSSLTVAAQDEGVINKRERIGRDAGIFLSFGPSFTFGKNIGDYSTGFNMEGGFLKRLNRVVSIGPSVSYLSFKYDPEKTGYNNIFASEEFYDSEFQTNYFNAILIDFNGGDMTLVSAACNLKFNIIPITDNTKFSVYGFAKPFITFANRKAVKGVATIFSVYDEDYDDFYSEEEIINGASFATEVPWEANDPTWADYGINISEALEKDSRVTGGIFVGPGVEFMPAGKVTVFAQAAFGYTFPVSFVSTDSYYEEGSFDELTEEYPIEKEGFPSLNVQVGLSFNF